MSIIALAAEVRFGIAPPSELPRLTLCLSPLGRHKIQCIAMVCMPNLNSSFLSKYFFNIAMPICMHYLYFKFQSILNAPFCPCYSTIQDTIPGFLSTDWKAPHMHNVKFLPSGSRVHPAARQLFLGECKSWTLDSGLDHGLDYGLEYGLNSRLIFKLLAMVASHDLH